MTNSFITVVIPTYNRNNILINTIVQFENQSDLNFELLIIDQSDHPQKEISLYKSPNYDYRYIHLTTIGLPNARNHGAGEARGDIIIFIDDDSIPDKNLVASYKKLFQSLGQNILIGGRVIEKGTNIFKEGKNIIGGWITWYGKTLKNFDTDNAGECEWVPGGNFAVSQNLFFQAGGFDTNFIGTAVMEDGDFGYAVIKNGGKVYYHPDPVIKHLRIQTGGVRQKNLAKGMFYRAHNTVYFFRKYERRRFLLFVFIYLNGVALKEWVKNKHGFSAFIWTWGGFYKGFITVIK